MNEIQLANELSELLQQQMNGIDNSKKIDALKIIADENDSILFKLAYDKALFGLMDMEVQELTENSSIPEHIQLIKKIYSNSNYGLVKVNGTSMIDSGIEDRDYCIINKNMSAKQYSTVVAVYKGKYFIKKFTKLSKLIVLKSANKYYEDITINEIENFKIVGVVVSVLKNC